MDSPVRLPPKDSLWQNSASPSTSREQLARLGLWAEELIHQPPQIRCFLLKQDMAEIIYDFKNHFILNQRMGFGSDYLKA